MMIRLMLSSWNVEHFPTSPSVGVSVYMHLCDDVTSKPVWSHSLKQYQNTIQEYK